MEHISSEVEALKRKRVDLVQQIGTFTEMVTRGHNDVNVLRDQSDYLKKEC